MKKEFFLITKMFIISICIAHSQDFDPKIILYSDSDTQWSAFNRPLVGDYNNDGKVDLIFSNEFGTYALINNGMLSFETLLLNNDETRRLIKLVDLNNDGFIDIWNDKRVGLNIGLNPIIDFLEIELVGNSGFINEVFLFSELSTFPSYVERKITSSDGQSEGYIALATATEVLDYELQILETTDKWFNDIQHSDVDQNGVNDIVSIEHSEDLIHVWLFTDSLDFSHSTIAMGDERDFFLAISDLDGDDFPEMITMGNGPDFGMYYYPNTNGYFGERVFIGSTINANIETCAIGDIDSDGDNDLVAIVKNNETDDTLLDLMIFKNDGNGSISSGITIETGFSIASHYFGASINESIILADINSDEYLDITAISRDDNGIVTWINNPQISSNSEENSNEERVILYPNPTNSNFTINHDLLSSSDYLEIRDISGAILHRWDGVFYSDNYFNIELLSSGTYFIVAYKDAKVVFKERLIKS